LFFSKELRLAATINDRRNNHSIQNAFEVFPGIDEFGRSDALRQLTAMSAGSLLLQMRRAADRREQSKGCRGI
jgi:hypothetical protein